MKHYFPVQVQILVQSKIIQIITILRICFALNLNLLLTNDVIRWIYHPVFLSIIINPIYTIDHVFEANAIRLLFNNVNNNNSSSFTKLITTTTTTNSTNKYFALAYINNHIKLPPLLVAFIESIVYTIFPQSKLLSDSVSNIIVIIILRLLCTVIDLYITKLLYHIATTIFHIEDSNPNSKETFLLKRMSTAIHPNLSHIFEVMPVTATTAKTITPLEKTANTITTEQQDTNVNINTTNGSTSNTIGITIPIIQRKDVPIMIALLYYTSPIIILSSSCIGSFQNIIVLLLCCSLYEIIMPDRSIIWCSFYLALASYINIHYIIFIIPLYCFITIQRQQQTQLQQQQQQQREKQQQQQDEESTKKQRPIHKFSSTILLSSFIICLITLHYLAYILVESISIQDYLRIVCNTNGYSFQLQELEPSLSMLWYFSMEVFEKFRFYFTLMLGGLPYLLIAPITIRLYSYPIVLIAIFWTIGVLFRPPGTLYELNVGICWMMFSPQSLARMPQILLLISLGAILVTICLYIVSYWMWIGPNTGEANFVYFQCLAYNVFVSLLFLMFCSSSVRRDKALRITEKDIVKNKQC